MAESRTTRKPTRTSPAVLGRREPSFRLIPDGTTGSRGQEAVDLARAAGLELDGFQQDWLMDGMATSGDRWAADEIVGVLSRQNGKSVVLVIRGLWGPTFGGEGLVLFTSHQYKAAGEAFLLAKQICETPALAQLSPESAPPTAPRGSSSTRADGCSLSPGAGYPVVGSAPTS